MAVWLKSATGVLSVLVTDIRRRPAPTDVPDATESGVAMIGTLLVVIILGILVTIVLTNQPAAKNTTQETTSSGALVTTTTVPQSVGSAAQQAAVSTCQLNFQAVTTALTDYKAVNGSNPAAGVAWATSSALGGPYMQTWPNGHPYYTLQWNGSALSVVPLRGTASHGSIGTSAPATGCFAA
jgi:type II secretory pathway pseudopilin PulG